MGKDRSTVTDRKRLKEGGLKKEEAKGKLSIGGLSWFSKGGELTFQGRWTFEK